MNSSWLHLFLEGGPIFGCRRAKIPYWVDSIVVGVAFLRTTRFSLLGQVLVVRRLNPFVGQILRLLKAEFFLRGRYFSLLSNVIVLVGLICLFGGRVSVDGLSFQLVGGHIC